jgi:CheY-specific phosphatase CheX
MTPECAILAINQQSQTAKRGPVFRGGEMTEMQAVTEEQLPEVLLDCVKESVRKTFAAICGAEPALQGGAENGMVDEGVVGIISLVGDIAWTLMVGLPRETATALALSFAGFEIDFESEEIGDFAGELANTIGGDLQNRLHGIDVNAELSVPTVTRGNNLRLMLPGNLAAICFHYGSANGEFWIKLASQRPDENRIGTLAPGGG